MLGVSILIAILGTPASGDALARFDAGWVFMVLTGMAGAIAIASLGPVRVAGAEQPAASGPLPAERTRTTVWHDPITAPLGKRKCHKVLDKCLCDTA